MFTVYSKPACTYCDQAKALLEAKGLQFRVINLDVGQPKIPGEKYVAREAFIKAWPSQRTLPLIMRDEQYVGGFIELKSSLTEAHA